MATSKSKSTRKLQLVTKGRKLSAKGRKTGRDFTIVTDFPKLSAKSRRESEEITLTREQFNVMWEALNFAMYECQVSIDSTLDKNYPISATDENSVILLAHEQAFCRFNRLRYGLASWAGVCLNALADNRLFPESGFYPDAKGGAA